MAMAKSIPTVTNTSAFFCHLFFIHNYRKMTITFYGFDASGKNSFMGMDLSVKGCLSLYNNIAVLSSWLSLVADYICLIILLKKHF